MVRGLSYKPGFRWRLRRCHHQSGCLPTKSGESPLPVSQFLKWKTLANEVMSKPAAL